MIKQVIIGTSVLDTSIHPTGAFLGNVPTGINLALESITPLKSKAVIKATEDQPENDLEGEVKTVNKSGVAFIYSSEKGAFKFLNYDFSRFAWKGKAFAEYFRKIPDLTASLAINFKTIACVPFLNKEGKPYYPPFAREGYQDYLDAIETAKALLDGDAADNYKPTQQMRDELNATGPSPRYKDMYYRVLEIDKPIIQYNLSEVDEYVKENSLNKDMYKEFVPSDYAKFLTKFRVENSGMHPDLYIPKLEKAEKAFRAKPVSKPKGKK